MTGGPITGSCSGASVFVELLLLPKHRFFVYAPGGGKIRKLGVGAYTTTRSSTTYGTYSSLCRLYVQGGRSARRDKQGGSHPHPGLCGNPSGVGICTGA